MKRPDADALYSDFISALFVALLFSWVQSSLLMIQCVGQYIENSSVSRNGVQAAVAPSVGEDASLPIDSSKSQDKIQSVPRGHLLRSILLLPALVCIWWWYQMHLARYAPARTFVAYAMDFTTLLLFAVAIFHWSSSGKLFYFAIVLPTLAMIVRFWHAYNRKRLPWIPRSRRRLVYGGLATLFVTLVCLLIVVYTKWHPETHNLILLLCIAAGVAVTTFSAAATEGFTVAHPAPVVQPTDILVFLPPTHINEYKDVPFASIAQFDRLAAIRFENELTLHAPPAYRYIHMSNVHSLGDTRVHAFILSIPSVDKPDEVIAKCYLTYAAHWLDDMFDRQINRRHLSRRIFSTDRKSQYDPAKQVDPKFRLIIERVMTDITHREYASVAIERLMLGSLIFHTGSIAEKAAVQHRNLIRKYLLDDDDWSQKKAVLNWFNDIMNHMFVHLTAKTIQELWFACEEQKQPFGLTFLYSVLYGPALYYHDKTDEIKCGEMAEGASAAGLLPDAAAVANVIKDVGRLIAEYEGDPLRKARKIQISTVARSFQIVLEKQVRDAYECVASML